MTGHYRVSDEALLAETKKYDTFFFLINVFIALKGTHFLFLFTLDQIDALDDAEIVKLYARYEARLWAAVTKTLGSAALRLYAGVASMFFPIENQPAFVADLEADPLVGHALSSVTCELYHRYGMLLAPLTAALTTMKYCQFGHQCPQTINDDGEPTDGGKDGKSDGSSSRDD